MNNILLQFSVENGKINGWDLYILEWKWEEVFLQKSILIVIFL